MLDTIKLDFQPVADPAAIVQNGPVRFTVLTSKLIRMEYDPLEKYEDRPTQVFWHRKQPVPAFEQRLESNCLTIETADLILKYTIQDYGFYPRALQVELKSTGFVWEFGQENNTNLLGTVRTLDRANGPVPLNPGLLSRNGWSVVDDSTSLVFNSEGWLETRSADPGAKDLYFFGYGHDYAECIVDFQKLSGRVPILPRFALGNWWSRYWEYEQDELVSLMRDFRQHNVPLSVCIVDMDWHIVETGNQSSGWTGYTWNKDFFPEPQRFLNELNGLGLKTALNLHPASGIHPHEAQYEAMAEKMGVDSTSQEPVPFDIADPRFTETYFEVLHHPMEDMGIDFWWLDWQQGTKSTIEGLDPLFWLNHLHFYDRNRDHSTRPFIFSRWGGLGSQRYPIGFSGDTYVTWETLHFQPYFTATAANVAYGWWSHDIGGHMGGVEEPELYLRWIQMGVFSPILRLHSTKNPYHERRPWDFDAETEQHTAQAMRLRHTLIPYLYTAAWRNQQEGLLPIVPMYHLYPDEAAAYQCPNEATFGTELITVPYTTPCDEHTRLSRQAVWLPEGAWFDYFSGQHFEGGGWHAVYGGLERTPVFAKAGAIVPQGPMAGWGGIDLPDALTLSIFPGADNSFQLYEDDGETTAYENGEFAITSFHQKWQDNQLTFTIDPVKGVTDLLSKDRIFKLVFYSLNQPEQVKLFINGDLSDGDWRYDETRHQLTITDLVLPVTTSLTVNLVSDSSLLYSGDDRKATLKMMLKVFKMNSDVKLALLHKLDEFMADPRMLINLADRMEDSHIVALVETWLGKQTDQIPDHQEQALQKIINMMF